MPAWLSPFPIPDAMAAELARQGWTPWRGAEEELPPDGAWLYDAPDGLLSQLGLAPAEMLAGYRQLLDAPIGTRLVALRRLLPNGASDPLAAVLAQQALQQQPGLLDAYLDLELRADLQGDEPDSHYRRRLQDQLAIEPLLAAWKELRDSSALRGTIEESEGLRQELEAAKQELESLRASLEVAQSGEQEAREEAELTLLQLHQVQEELEHYFLLSRGQTQQLERYDALQQRSHRLLARCLNAPAAAPAG